MIYRFGSFELDRLQYRLSRQQTTIRVEPRALNLLAYLIEHRERAVSKEELFSQLWGGRFVSDGVLTAAVYAARRALGERAGQAAFIKTLYGRGYQFHFRPVQMVATTRDSLAASRAGYLLWTGGPTPLQDGENGIGRDPESVVVLDSLRVSRHHARIVVAGGAPVLEDLTSKNGTVLNGRRIAAPTSVREGDVIEIGGVALTFQGRLSDLSTLTQERDSGSAASGAVVSPLPNQLPRPR